MNHIIIYIMYFYGLSVENMKSTKQEWIDLIEQKLKDGQSYEDLIRTEHGVVREPIQMSREGMLDIPVVQGTTRSIISIDALSNTDIRTLLDQGIQSLYASHPMDDVDSMLEGVERSYLDIFLTQAGEGCRYIDKVIDIDGVIPSYLASSQMLPQEKEKSILIRFRPTTDFNLTIAQVRLLRYILHTHDIDGKIVALVKDTGACELGAYNLIEVTYKTLSTMIGGAEYVEYDTSDEEAFRLHQNILWMLIHEASMDSVADPARGSYLIENLTTQLYQKLDI